MPDGKRRILFSSGIVLDNRFSFDDLVKKEKELKEVKKYSYYDGEIGLVEAGFEKFVSVPCGMCRECLTQRARDWSFRIMKECEIHDDNWFITLTYDDEHIPKNMMLDKNAISSFNKNLKSALRYAGFDSTFRFYGVGEYGGQTARPHYHVIYFGLPIPDLKFVTKTKDGNLIFDSDFIKKVWDNGFITIEGVSIGSACYVARYCDKKKRLNKLEKAVLEEKGIVPEFSRMSNRPGIGAHFLDTAIDKFNNGIFNSYINGKSYSFPMYYNKKIKELFANTPELKDYENNARLNSSIKIANNLLLADNVDSLYHYNDYLDSGFSAGKNRKL